MNAQMYLNGSTAVGPVVYPRPFQTIQMADVVGVSAAVPGPGMLTAASSSSSIMARALLGVLLPPETNGIFNRETQVF